VWGRTGNPPPGCEAAEESTVKDADAILREVLQRIQAVEGKLNTLTQRLSPLLERLEKADDPLTRNLSVPKDFNEGPHLPGLG
jgi:hypothetical protein